MKDFVEWISLSELMKRWEVDNDIPIFDAVKNGLSVFERIGPGKTKLVDASAISGPRPTGTLFFKRSDIERYEAENGETLPDGKTLSYNAMLKQPVFQKSMSVMTDILLYCEKNRPAKREGAYADFSEKHKISKHVFDALWKTIPVEMKRKAGQRDR